MAANNAADAAREVSIILKSDQVNVPDATFLPIDTTMSAIDIAPSQSDDVINKPPPADTVESTSDVVTQPQPFNTVQSTSAVVYPSSKHVASNTKKNQPKLKLNMTLKTKPIIIRPKFDPSIQSNLRIGYDKDKIPNPEPIIITINKEGLNINGELVDTKDKWDAARELYLGYGKSQDDFKLPTYTNGELRFIIDLQEQKMVVHINKGKAILINNSKQLEELKAALNKV